MLWAYKEAHIITAIILLILVIRKIILQKINQLYQYRICFYVMIVLLYSTIILEQSLSTETTQIYLKLISSLFVLIYGLLDKNPLKTIQITTKFCIALIFINFITAIFGYGRQTWGGANVYAGIYYFKTDLALAITIALSIILINNDIKVYYKYLLILISLYLIIISNARAYYVINFIIISLYLFKDKLIKNFLYLIILIPMVYMMLLFGIDLLKNYFGESMLTLDISFGGFMSIENTQGRSGIWEVLISDFLNQDLTNQLIGLGYVADSQMTFKILNNELAGADAHNGYLYTLIATGWIGLTIFIIFLVYSFYILIKLATNEKLKINKQLTFLIMYHFIIYTISNFSSRNIIFQQESWFFMYLMGVMFNQYNIKIKSFSKEYNNGNNALKFDYLNTQ